MEFGRREFFSYLDGVSVRIGERFRPPRRITLPISYNPAIPSEILTEEYDFSLEKQVLALAEKRRQAQEAVEKEKVEKVGLAIEEFTKTASEKSDASQVVEQAIMEKNSEETSATKILPSWHSDCILQPLVPEKLAENEPKPNDEKSNKSINLADFENDASSPFDYMELQTINDLEELNTVFQGMNTNVPSSENHTSEKVAVSVQEGRAHFINSESVETIKSLHMDQPVTQNAYNSVPSHIPSLYSSISHSAQSNLKTNYLNPFLTPVASRYISESNTTSTSVPTVNKSDGTTVSHDSSHIINGTPGGVSSISSNFITSGAPTSVSGALPKEWSKSSHYSISSSVPSSLRLRNSKSYTDIRQLPEVENCEEISSRPWRSNTPPPRSNTRRLSGEQENVWASANSVMSVTSSQTKAVTELSLETSDLPLNNDSCSSTVPKAVLNTETVSSLPDPYDEFSNEEKSLVDSITDMGFPRGQVSRAVKHLGKDIKKVVDHLCLVQTLIDAGYDGSDAEIALHLHDYNEDDARKYLDMLNQFRDLGFEKTAITKALIQHKNDRDKALDALLA